MVYYRLGIYYGPKDSEDINLMYVAKLNQIDTLKSLDSFTQNFEDEMELKEELESTGSLQKLWKEREFSIIYKNRGYYYKLPVSYNEDKDEIKLVKLWGKILDLKYNTKFLRELVKYYTLPEQVFNIYSSELGDIRRYINDVESSGHVFESSTYDKSLDSLYNKIIYKLNSNNEKELNYRGLRDLYFFVKEYNRNEKKSQLEDLENKRNLEKIKEKIFREEQQKRFDAGQLDLFDFMSNEDQRRINEERYHRGK